MNPMSSLSGQRSLVVPGAAIVAAVLMFCQPAVALNPALDVSQYAHTSWTVADGFAKGAILNIAQTPDGYLWLGTEFGLLRFDGVRTTPWPSDRLLPSTKIRTLLTGRDGTLWIGTTQGLASWKDGKLTVYAELADHRIATTIESHDGSIWTIGLTPPTGELCRIRNRDVRCWGSDGLFGSRVATMYEDRKGNLWFAELHGVWRWNEGQPRFYPLPRDQFVRALSEDSDGVLLVLLSGTLYRMVDGELQEVSRLPGASGQLTTSVQLLRDRDGDLWIGAFGGGLTHLHQGQIDQFSQSDGLSSNTIEGLFQDREGNIWVATNSGLDRFRELPVTPATLRQGFSSLNVLAVLASRDGSIWLRTVDGVNHWRDGRVTVYREFPEPSNTTRSPIPPPVKDDAPGNTLGAAGGSLFEDERGRVWLSTLRSVGYLDHGRFSAVRGVPGGRVNAITGDLKGNIWLAHEAQGLFHLANGQVVDQISWARLGHSDHADALAVDPATGGLWLGFFRGGIEVLEDGQMRTLQAVPEGHAEGRINDLRFGRDGALWVAAEGGVNRLTNGRAVTLSSQDGLPCSEAHWTMEDDAGDLWLSMPCGLVRIARTELDAWARAADGKPHPPSTVRFTVFDGSDGVRSRAEAGGFSPHVAKATDGRLWFLPLDGLSVMDPRRLSLNTLPPPVSVEQIIADRTSYEASSLVDGRVRLPPLVRDLQIDYTALSLIAPEKMRFRYKLEGWDRDWQDAGTRRQAFYSNLPPRQYQFRVMAANNSGVWNEAGAALDFSVAPAYYQTNWFQALAFGTIAMLVWTAHRIRVRIIKKHEHEISALNERLMKAQEQERSRIAGELHDDVMQQVAAATVMLGTAKRRIADNPDAKATIEMVQQKLIQVGTDIRQLSHGLHPAVLQEVGLPKVVEAYCEEFGTTSGIPVTCDADEGVRDLSRGAALALFRIVQEAIGNAAKHAAAMHITVRLARSDDAVSLIVSDDGVGIDRIRAGRAGGLGLIMMRERATQLNGTFDVDSASGLGTTIRVVIPFR